MSPFVTNLSNTPLPPNTSTKNTPPQTAHLPREVSTTCNSILNKLTNGNYVADELGGFIDRSKSSGSEPTLLFSHPITGQMGEYLHLDVDNSGTINQGDIIYPRNYKSDNVRGYPASQRSRSIDVIGCESGDLTRYFVTETHPNRDLQATKTIFKGGQEYCRISLNYNDQTNWPGYENYGEALVDEECIRP